MQVVIHKKIDVLKEIYPSLEELKTEFHETTFFQKFSWLKAWWDSQSQLEKIKPYIVEIKSENNTIGILPLYLSYKEFAGFNFRLLKPIGAFYSDYLLPLCSKKYPIERQLKVAFEKIHQDKSSWDGIDWDDIPEGSLFDNFLKKQTKIDQTFINRRQSEVCPYLILNHDIEKVKKKFSKKFLKGILYYERKLKREGELKYHRITRESEINPIMIKLFELHRERWGYTDTPSQFENYEERQRVMKIAKSLFDNDLLHLSYLSHNGEIAAVELGIADDTNRYLYIGAINVDFRKYPIGHILLYYLVVEACEEGYKIMDFLRGEEGYKQRAGTINKYNVQYKFFNRTMRSLLFRKINHTYYSSKFDEEPKLKQIFTKSLIRGIVLVWSLPIIKS